MGNPPSSHFATSYFHLPIPQLLLAPSSIFYLPSSTMMTFEDLEAWQQARQLVKSLYNLTRTGALARDFGISSQIQRAGVSIMSNIAEGFERLHLQEKLQFYNVARGSSAEVRSLLYVIEDNYAHFAQETARLRESVVHIGKLTSGLIGSTQSRRSRTARFLSSFFQLTA